MKPSGSSGGQITAEQVAEGLYAWLAANQWFLKDKLDAADPTLEQAAHEALLMLARGECDDYRRLPSRVRGLALQLTLDFMAKLLGPLSAVTWPVVSSPPEGSAALQQAAWQVVQLEIARSSAPPSVPH